MNVLFAFLLQYTYNNRDHEYEHQTNKRDRSNHHASLFSQTREYDMRMVGSLWEWEFHHKHHVAYSKQRGRIYTYVLP